MCAADRMNVFEERQCVAQEMTIKSIFIEILADCLCWQFTITGNFISIELHVAHLHPSRFATSVPPTHVGSLKLIRSR